MTRPRTALILIAFVAFISLGLPDGVLGVAWPSVRRTFDVPVSQFGLLLAAGTCGYLISSFSSGALVRRLGVGRLLLGSSVLMVFASAGYALAPAWFVMVALGVSSGLGAGAIDAGLNAYAAHHFSPRLVNWLHAFYGVGATLGPLLMTAVLSAGLAWRWGYATNAALLAVMSLCFLFTLRLWDGPTATDGAAGTGGEAAAAASAAAPTAEAPPSAGTLETLRRPVVALSVVLFFLYTGVEVAAGQWTYSLFTEARGVTPAVAGTWVGAYWASLTAGRVFFGTVAGRLPPLAVVRATMLVVPLGAILIWADAAPLANFLGLALMGFCFAPMFPLLISLTPRRVGAAAGHHAIGFQVAAAGLGAAGVPGLTGLLAKWGGLEVIGPVLAGTCVLMLAVHEVIVRVTGTGEPDVTVAPAAPAREQPASL